MNSYSNLVQYNIDCLRQGISLIQRLTQPSFSLVDPPVYESSIGEHLRHIVEHYLCFLAGIPKGCVDYDARQRDSRISSDREYAEAEYERVCSELDALDSNNAGLEVKMAGTKDDEDGSPCSESSGKRELQYLQAHTIHHYALISMIMRIQGIETDGDFGVAPSTLRHRMTSDMAVSRES
ncbi:MAG: hypothetical protein BMS9Abin05_0678 [Rhodothermia bacterium]|nr:MAG: hypothetical protein BMS9Abin05_0678 [Rhodothermia bacterium]